MHAYVRTYVHTHLGLGIGSPGSDCQSSHVPGYCSQGFAQLHYPNYPTVTRAEGLLSFGKHVLPLAQITCPGWRRLAREESNFNMGVSQN